MAIKQQQNLVCIVQKKKKKNRVNEIAKPVMHTPTHYYIGQERERERERGGGGGREREGVEGGRKQ